METEHYDCLPIRGAVFLLLIVGLAGAVTGCEAFGEEQTVILSDTELTFTYRFNGSDVSTGETTELTSANTVAVNLSAVLGEHGFGLQDLRSITVNRAAVGLTFPVQRHLDFLEQISIFLRTEQLSPVLVGERQQIPDGQRRITVPVESARDIEAYVREPMRGILRIGSDRELSDEQYEMDVTLRLAIEVGGL